ncbi:unnamed protein product [Allacma fusca]|uniref:Uncharacterized protein n=1 Tax=Allacma fusca TaxID=39272 RepID=A0A8J2P1I6_9HEXA|nr:unnamed protein product [Allacma fusca]
MTNRDEDDVILVSSESEEEKVEDGIADPVGVGGTASNKAQDGFKTDVHTGEEGLSNGGTMHAQPDALNVSQDSCFSDEIMQLLDGVPSTVSGSDGICSAANGSQPSTSDSIECIDLDEDIERLLQLPTSSTPTVDPTEKIKEEIRNVLETFVYSLKKCMTPKEKLKVKDQLWNAFDKIDFRKDTQEIKEFVDEIVKQSKDKPKSTWRLVKKLLDFMNSRKQSGGRKQNKYKPEDETPEERSERKNYERIVQLEKRLAKMEKAIEEYGQKEVELSDERNSSYLIRTRMINE